AAAREGAARGGALKLGAPHASACLGLPWYAGQMEKLARRQAQEDKLAKALQDSLAQITQGFQQLMEGSEAEAPHDRVKTRDKHIIEEARLNYDQALQEL